MHKTEGFRHGLIESFNRVCKITTATAIASRRAFFFVHFDNLFYPLANVLRHCLAML